MENINLAKIAELAYLEIQESEKEKLAKTKLEQVVEYVGKIKELDFANVSKENNTPEHKSLRLHPDIPQKTEIDNYRCRRFVLKFLKLSKIFKEFS